MPNQVGTMAPLPRSAFAAYLGRNQGPELFFTQTHTGAAGTTIIPKTLSMNRPLEGLMLRWTGRVVVAVANYAVVAAEAPSTIIDRIKVFGTYKGTALTPIDLTGATAQVWARLFGYRSSTVAINATRQAEPSQPFQQLAANFGNIGTYDLDIWYFIPMWPMISPSARANNILPFCWQPRDWNDTLQIQLNLGDLSSFGTPGGGGTTTFTAFGSGAGSPSIQIYTRYLIAGPLRAGFHTNCVIRNENNASGTVTAIANAIRLGLLQKQKTTNVVVKTGRILTGTTSGVNVYSDLRDILLNETQIIVDNRPIRQNRDNLTFKEHIGIQYNTVLPEGYLNFSFCDSQQPRSAFRGDLPNVVAPGASFELTTNVIEANANSTCQITQEQIFSDVDDPFWGGTR
jgi:hypothetical protein